MAYRHPLLNSRFVTAFRSPGNTPTTTVEYDSTNYIIVVQNQQTGNIGSVHYRTDDERSRLSQPPSSAYDRTHRVL
jgi:hypothetical protein